MIVLPAFNPDLLVIAGVIRVKWYGFMYVLGFFSAWMLGQSRLSTYGISRSQFLDYLTYVAVGIIVGGRLGYMMIYQWTAFYQQPWTILAIWQGGMAFHGALLGGLVAAVIFARSCHIPLSHLIDFTAPLIAPGLFLGRLGNFINGELWGRVTDMPWGMVFPRSDGLPRHPSQLYEMVGEGLLLYVIMNWHRQHKPLRRGALGAWFTFHYGWIRFALEFFREPDDHIGFVAYNFLSMGQCLCMVMVLTGLLWVLRELVQRRYVSVSLESSS